MDASIVLKSNFFSKSNQIILRIWGVMYVELSCTSASLIIQLSEIEHIIIR